MIWSVNATEPMVPASTVKLLTTGFARTTLGAEARRPTRVIGTGGVDPATGTWKGRWALQLNGDPTLERADGSGPTLFELATQLRSIGIRQMTGPLALHTMVGEPTAAYPTAWHSRHRGRYFAPPVGPVTLNENLVVFTIAPGGSSGSTPIITSDAPRGVSSLVSIEARTINGSRNALVVRQRGGGWVVTGTIGTRAGARRYSYVAHRPVDVVEATWARALQDAGIEWNEGPSIGSPMPDHYRVLAEVADPGRCVPYADRDRPL